MWEKGKKAYNPLTYNSISNIESFPTKEKPKYVLSPEDIIRVAMIGSRTERIFLDCFLQTGDRRYGTDKDNMFAEIS